MESLNEGEIVEVIIDLEELKKNDQLNESFFMKGDFYCFRSNPTNNRVVDENYVIIGSGSSDRDYFPGVEHLLWPSAR